MYRGETNISKVFSFQLTYLNVKLIDPNRQVGIRMQIEVIYSFLDAAEDFREGFVVKHASLQRTDLQVYFLLNQQKIIHLRKKK